MTPSGNRLLNEKSPYLLQHAHNPVDWYPWGVEAFEKARQEDKPILLSIGYSTCHWCHVMERESFEDPEIAALMNQALVNIKVDREERPDIDKIYMTAVSAMTGQGGWPLNVFLTPDLKPFYGGTYFPPEARWGHPAWRDVVQQVSEAWRSPVHRQKVLEVGRQITESLKQYATALPAPLEGDPARLKGGMSALAASYDPSRGGFAQAPKFPMPVYHNFLLRYYARTQDTTARDMSLHTLREMAKGGIYDHLGGGFARYSTDPDWHVPHFEKMLYDNAQLVVNYLEAFQVTRDPDFSRIARETLAYIQRDMTHPDGGFYSAEDADSLPSGQAAEKKEGAFYVWTEAEMAQVLDKKEAEIFSFRYGVREKGNVTHDPHGEFAGQNILYVAHPIPEIATHFHVSSSEVENLLESSREKLFQTRAKRPRPHLDDKIISAWNGLMISAFAKAYQVLGDASYLESARKAMAFLQASLFSQDKKILYRRWREGQVQGPGIADDYAFVIQALLDLYEADFDPEWLQSAADLTDILNQRFLDIEQGGYYMTASDQDPHLLIRVKEDQDNVEPSANSIATLTLLRLSQYLDRQDWMDIARQTLRTFGQTLKESPQSMPQMLVALDFALTAPRQIVIAGDSTLNDTKALLKILHHSFVPVKTVFLVDGVERHRTLAKRLPFLKEIKSLEGKATAYVCKEHACQQPTNDPSLFQSLIDGLKS